MWLFWWCWDECCCWSSWCCLWVLVFCLCRCGWFGLVFVLSGGIGLCLWCCCRNWIIGMWCCFLFSRKFFGMFVVMFLKEVLVLVLVGGVVWWWLMVVVLLWWVVWLILCFFLGGRFIMLFCYCSGLKWCYFVGWEFLWEYLWNYLIGVLVGWIWCVCWIKEIFCLLVWRVC